MENYDLTLRDYFAAASLSKLAEHGPAPGCSGVQASVIARRCYELADAMLAARSQCGLAAGEQCGNAAWGDVTCPERSPSSTTTVLRSLSTSCRPWNRCRQTTDRCGRAM